MKEKQLYKKGYLKPFPPQDISLPKKYEFGIFDLNTKQSFNFYLVSAKMEVSKSLGLIRLFLLAVCMYHWSLITDI